MPDKKKSVSDAKILAGRRAREVQRVKYDRILRANLGFLVDECGAEKVVWRGQRRIG